MWPFKRREKVHKLTNTNLVDLIREIVITTVKYYDGQRQCWHCGAPVQRPEGE